MKPGLRHDGDLVLRLGRFKKSDDKRFTITEDTKPGAEEHGAGFRGALLRECRAMNVNGAALSAHVFDDKTERVGVVFIDKTKPSGDSKRGCDGNGLPPLYPLFNHP